MPEIEARNVMNEDEQVLDRELVYDREMPLPTFDELAGQTEDSHDEDASEEATSEDATRLLAKREWIEHPYTQVVLNELAGALESKIDEAAAAKSVIQGTGIMGEFRGLRAAVQMIHDRAIYGEKTAEHRTGRRGASHPVSETQEG